MPRSGAGPPPATGDLVALRRAARPNNPTSPPPRRYPRSDAAPPHATGRTCSGAVSAHTDGQDRRRHGRPLNRPTRRVRSRGDLALGRPCRNNPRSPPLRSYCHSDAGPLAATGNPATCDLRRVTCDARSSPSGSARPSRPQTAREIVSRCVPGLRKSSQAIGRPLACENGAACPPDPSPGRTTAGGFPTGRSRQGQVTYLTLSPCRSTDADRPRGHFPGSSLHEPNFQREEGSPRSPGDRPA